MSERIAVAISGGVDSAVAAHLLKKAGHNLIALTIASPFHIPETTLDDARRVADDLNIPLHLIDLTDGFDDLLTYLCDEYLAGRTPNPCIRCNSLLKFGSLIKAARSLDCSALATGHYVRRQHLDARWTLLRGADLDKDQSYFLFELTHDQIAFARFPLGDLTKTDVRRHADELHLHVRHKPESQEICMVPDDDYPALIRRLRPDSLIPGDIIDTDGNVLGRHHGIACYTIGQRRGLGIAAPHPLYVVAIDPASNRITVGPDHALYAQQLIARNLNWIAGDPPTQPRPAHVRIRYRHTPAPANLVPIDPETLRVTFDQPQRAVTPGQAAVFYDNDLLLGGGWIA